MKSSNVLRVMMVILLLLIILAGWDALGRPGWPVSSSSHSSGIPGVTMRATPTSPPVQLTLPATLNVASKQWGMSTCYIGAVEGSSRFNIADLQDLGINTYKIYGG